MLSDITKIKDAALRLLARREHSQRELYKALKRYHVTSELIHSLLDELAELGLQSDERFTEVYVNSRMNRGYGPRKIIIELQDRGINHELIGKYVDTEDIKWHQCIEKVYHKRFKPTKDLKECMKQKKFLEYRGFSFEQINTIFKHLDSID